jgi:hypothetical protein
LLSQSVGMWRGGFFAVGSTGSQRSATARRDDLHRVSRDTHNPEEQQKDGILTELQVNYPALADGASRYAPFTPER